MNSTELTLLMHAVLDGEATRQEAQALERRLADDPAARSEFDELRRLFDGLAAMPKAHPPEGLVASVMARLPQHKARQRGADQPFFGSGVIGEDFKETLGTVPGRSAGVDRVSGQGTFFRSQHMSEQSGSFLGKRKVWIGGGLAAVAVIFAMSSGVDFPPNGRDTSGTIAPAQRYRAPQNTAADVKLGDPSSQQSGQTNPTADAVAGQNQGGANQGGANQGGANQGGANQGGVNQGGVNQGGVNQGGVNQGGANQGGANQGGANQGQLNQGVQNKGALNQGTQNQAITR
jgi:hypothetical protein